MESFPIIFSSNYSDILENFAYWIFILYVTCLVASLRSQLIFGCFSAYISSVLWKKLFKWLLCNHWLDFIQWQFYSLLLLLLQILILLFHFNFVYNFYLSQPHPSHFILLGLNCTLLHSFVESSVLGFLLLEVKRKDNRIRF